MSVLADIVADILARAGKTGNTNQAMVTRAVKDVLANINLRMSSEVVKGRKVVSAAASANAIDAPKTAMRIIEVGDYDSGTERIKLPWDEISERQYHAEFAAASEINPATGARRFCVLDHGGGGRIRIRPIPALSETTDIMFTFYAKATLDNINRLGSVVKDGVMGELASWFTPAVASYHMGKFERGLTALKRRHGTILHTVRTRQAPFVQRANIVGANLSS